MKHPHYFILIISFLLALSGMTSAQISEGQNDTTMVVIKTKDGNNYVGKIIRMDDEVIVIETESVGNIEIVRSKIKRMKEISPSSFINGEYWFENPNVNRNIYGPTGYSLRKGEGYYQNFMLFLNHVSYGFTDNLTVGVSFMPATFGEGIFISITPKFSFPIVENKLNVGVGGMFTSAYGESFGAAYGVATLGSRDNNFTFGLGYGFSDGEMMGSPMMTIGGMVRLSKRFGLVTENWMIPYKDTEYRYDPGTNRTEVISEKTKYEVLFTYGVRLMFEFISVDIGFINNKDIAEGMSLGLPLVGITVPFGNR